MRELIVFGHNDLDQAGCMINIEYRYPTVPKKYFHTNYQNIPQLVDEIIAYKEKNGSNVLLITDISFSEEKESLMRLYNAFEHCTHIDHHMYVDGFWNDMPNMKVVHDTTKSATLLCNEYFDNNGKCSQLDKLSTLIDVYDLWQDTNDAFDFTQWLNEYFWEVGIENFVNGVVLNDFKLPIDFKEVVGEIKEKINSKLNHYYENNLIHKSSNIVFAFVDDYFNHVLIREMKNGADFVIGMYNWGLVRVRISQHSGYSDERINNLRHKLTGNHEYGHLHAFTYRFKEYPKYEDVIEEAKRIGCAIRSI